MIFWCEWGVGLILTVVQCQANPRRGSKALTSSPWKNQSNIVGAVANPTRYQADKNRYYTLILAKRLRSDAHLGACWVSKETKITRAFEWTYFHWIIWALGCFIPMPWLRFIMIQIFGERLWPLWAHLPSIPPALWYHLSKLHENVWGGNVSGRRSKETFAVFTMLSWNWTKY